MSNIEENFTAITAEIVSAYVANNSVQAANLSALIASVHSAVSFARDRLTRPVSPIMQSPVQQSPVPSSTAA
jgi:predicted transcriptional regulator